MTCKLKVPIRDNIRRDLIKALILPGKGIYKIVNNFPVFFKRNKIYYFSKLIYDNLN